MPRPKIAGALVCLIASLLIGAAGCATTSTRDGAVARSISRGAVADRKSSAATSRPGKSIPSRIEPNTSADATAEHEARTREPISLVNGTAASGEDTPDDSTSILPPGELAEAGDSLLPPAAYTFSLADVLSLANAQNPNVAYARERINEAYARVDRAETLWLPSLRSGLNYNHHEGAIQNVAGNIFRTNRSAFYGGLGAGGVGASSPAVPGLVAQFHLTDAIFQPKIASHFAASRQFGATTARNDVLRDTAVAYLELIRAEQGVAIAVEALENTQKLAELTGQYAASGEGLQADHQRMEAEVAVRQDQLVSQSETVQVTSARLAQFLHADPSVLIASGEPVVVPIDVLEVDDTPAEYVATGLSRRPELAEQKHLVCEAVERLRREKYAPLVPSVLLGMSYGGMGCGFGTSIVNSSDRWDADALAFWEIRNLGRGERAAQNETSSLLRQARMRELALLDGVAREVVEAHTQVIQRRKRIEMAKKGIQAAERSYSLNLERIENAQGLPIEVLQAIQALATARRSYLGAVIDYNIAQFELCRAIGWFSEA